MGDEWSGDFGFTLVDEKDLDSVQQLNKVVEQSSGNFDKAQEKLDELYNAITPLLNNLKANPEREYIKWPDRVEKVEAFETFIQNIYAK
jgi:uncharacterized coiled-coil protein SlyX